MLLVSVEEIRNRRMREGTLPRGANGRHARANASGDAAVRLCDASISEGWKSLVGLQSMRQRPGKQRMPVASL